VQGDVVEAAIWESCGGAPGDEVFCTNDLQAGDIVNALTPGNTYLLQLWNDDGF